MGGFGWDPSLAKTAAAASADRASGHEIRGDIVAGVRPGISAVIGRVTSPQQVHRGHRLHRQALGCAPNHRSVCTDLNPPLDSLEPTNGLNQTRKRRMGDAGESRSQPKGPPMPGVRLRKEHERVVFPDRTPACWGVRANNRNHAGSSMPTPEATRASIAGIAL